MGTYSDCAVEATLTGFSSNVQAYSFSSDITITENNVTPLGADDAWSVFESCGKEGTMSFNTHKALIDQPGDTLELVMNTGSMQMTADIILLTSGASGDASSTGAIVDYTHTARITGEPTITHN